MSTRVSSTPACVAEASWEITVIFTRSSRSAAAPASGEAMTEGPRLQNAMIPTQSGECVSCQASHSTAMRCIHSPVQDARDPAKKMRALRCPRT